MENYPYKIIKYPLYLTYTLPVSPTIYTHKNCLGKGILMGTHIVFFFMEKYGKLSLNYQIPTVSHYLPVSPTTVVSNNPYSLPEYIYKYICGTRAKPWAVMLRRTTGQ